MGYGKIEAFSIDEAFPDSKKRKGDGLVKNNITGEYRVYGKNSYRPEEHQKKKID